MPWRELAEQQCGVIARRQLLAYGVDADRVRNEVRAQRWRERTSTVVSIFTGELTWLQRCWVAVLHAGGSALIGGLTALEIHGLKNWHREDVTVLVDDQLAFDPVPGVVFFRTRRPLGHFAEPTSFLPLCRPEPAALLFAGYDRSPRTAQGLVAAVLQQRVATPAALAAEMTAMRPLRRSPLLRATLRDIQGGSESLAEIDLVRLCRRFGLPIPRRQVRRHDSTGRRRRTDCEWALPDGRTLVLEIDGAFHMDAAHWEDDLARQRQLTATDRVIIRCTARELREQPDRVLRDLKNYGLCA